MNQDSQQIPLKLDHRPALGKVDYLVSASNLEAVCLVSGWRDWPDRHMALVGPRRAGKTHLAHVWMQESGAQLFPASGLDDTAAGWLVSNGRVVIEDVDKLFTLPPPQRSIAEKALFHLYNHSMAEDAWLLLTGCDAPGRWSMETPDLASRLAALPTARLTPPDDALLSSLIVKLFSDCQLQVAPGVVQYLSQRIERSFSAVESAVKTLDHLSLIRKKPVTRAMVSEVFSSDRAVEG